ncbi:MAG: DNA repair protein RecO [Planctomycetaceae bacterium]
MEKAEAIVIRQADFSESSRVITLFSREFGKFGCLAKGAKRLKGPFDAALDLLSTCRIVFLRKSSGSLSLLTQASLVRRFSPVPTDLNSLYGGYYVADLLNGLTEDFDPDARIFHAAEKALLELSESAAESATAIVQFEVTLLRLTGLFPNLTECTVCGHPVERSGRFTYWVGQGGLLCPDCRRPDYPDKSLSAGSIAVLQTMTDEESLLAGRVRMTRQQAAECHQLAVSAITNVLGRKPATLRYLKF